MSLNLYTHLTEIKWRFFYVILSLALSLMVGFYYKYELLYVIANPLLSLLGVEKSPLIFTHVIEAFYSFMELAFIISIFMTLPLIIYFIKLFLQPGLYEYELKRMNQLFIVIFIFYYIFSYILFYYIMPYCYYFFVTFGSSHLLFLAKFNEFIEFYCNIFTIFLIALFSPMFLFSLLLQVPSLFSFFSSSRHYIFLFILCLSAFITPPDVISLIILSIPLYLLLEISFFLFFLWFSYFENEPEREL